MVVVGLYLKGIQFGSTCHLTNMFRDFYDEL